MRILVTSGAGFIGSHTFDRLVGLGHDVVVLDALTAPVHRDRKPKYLTPGVELFVGDDLPDFATFIDANVTSTALLYELIVAERLDLSRVVVASSQAAMACSPTRASRSAPRSSRNRCEGDRRRWRRVPPGRLPDRTPTRRARPADRYERASHQARATRIMCDSTCTATSGAEATT